MSATVVGAIGEAGESRKEQAIREHEERKDRFANLAEQNAQLFSELAEARESVRAKDVMIDVLMKRIETFLAAPSPVAATEDPVRVMLSDGSVYEWRWPETASEGLWLERPPIPRTRRAIRQDEQWANSPFNPADEVPE